MLRQLNACESGRDSIYEGTNEVQAIDLLIRKVLPDGGSKLELLLTLMEAEARLAGSRSEIKEIADALATLVNEVRTVTRELATLGAADPEAPYRVATGFLQLLGHCALAWFWVWSARIAIEHESSNDPHYQAKLTTAKYYFSYVLPVVTKHLAIIRMSRISLGGVEIWTNH